MVEYVIERQYCLHVQRVSRSDFLSGGRPDHHPIHTPRHRYVWGGSIGQRGRGSKTRQAINAMGYINRSVCVASNMYTGWPRNFLFEVKTFAKRIKQNDVINNFACFQLNSIRFRPQGSISVVTVGSKMTEYTQEGRTENYKAQESLIKYYLLTLYSFCAWKLRHCWQRMIQILPVMTADHRDYLKFPNCCQYVQLTNVDWG